MNKKIAILFTLSFICLNVYSQRIDSTLSKYADDYPQEKVHIHFDKGIYNKGETVWFKAYIITGLDLSDCSKNFYADWFDDKGNLLKHTSMPVFASSARGQFKIPADYEGKSLHVKAYTRWMLNFDKAFWYNKDIKVDQIITQPLANTKAETNKKKSKVYKEDSIANTPPKTHNATIQFFPEGGVLLNGVVNKVAFLINNEVGMPVSAKGVLKNSEGVYIDSFLTEHDGMGSFTIQPDTAQTIFATWEDEYGVPHTDQLPIGAKYGASIDVEPTRAKTIFFVYRTKNAPVNFKSVYVIANIHQHEVYKSTINLSERLSAVGEIPTKELPSGVLQITLFDANYNPIAERVVFVNNYQFLFTPEVRITQKGLNKKEKNTIEIDVPDTLLSNMSVAVTDGSLMTDASSNIVSDLLMSGDVKGYIHNPSYYFASKSDSVFRNTDLVMLTHGWRKFQWKNVVAGEMPHVIYPKETEYMGFKGKILNDKVLDSIQNQQLHCILKAKDNSKHNLFLNVNKNGTFELPNIMFYDTISIFYQLTGNKRLKNWKDMTFQTELLPLTSNSNNSNLLSPFLWNNELNDSSLLERNRFFYKEKEKINKRFPAHQLEEVTVKTSIMKPMEDQTFSKGFSGTNGMTEFCRVVDPFAAVVWENGIPQLVLDGMIIRHPNQQRFLIENIEDIKGGGVRGGAISIKRRGIYDTIKGEGLNSQRLYGYTPYKEFYNPNYETMTPESIEEDARTTLYWNPFILTNGKTKTFEIEFYNNDFSKNLRLILEGINSDGKLARIEKIIE